MPPISRLKIIAGFVLITAFHLVHAQEENDEAKTYHFNGNISATNNGFSFIPTFTLGKPATILNLNVGGDRLTFEPQFRFDLDGLRPWSFVGFWRYKLIDGEKFTLKLGTQFPALAFRYEEAQSGGTTYDKILAQRFAVAELLTGYKVSEKVSFGTYYLRSKGLEKADQLRSADFFTFSTTIKNLNLTKKLRFRWDPQIYYLRIDENDGIYVTQMVSISHSGSAFSLASTLNKAVVTDIEAKDFDWNVSLVYSFANEFWKNRH